MAETQIEWTDATWNPVAGCSIVSVGCTNCYAMEMAKRLEAMQVEKYKGLTRRSGERTIWNGVVREDPARPHQRFERLLRDTGVFAGLLISEREERAEGEVRYYPEFRLIYTPRGETSGHQSFPIRPMAMVAPLLGRGALGVPGLLDGKGRHSIGLRWFAASELTLARPKAPQVAGRALSASPGEQLHRTTHIAMRPLRQKSRRIRGCSAFVS